MKRVGICQLLLCVSCLTAARPTVANDAAATIDLHPVVTADTAEMQVAMQFPAEWLKPSETLTFTLATFEQAYSRAKDRVQALVVRDADGIVPLSAPQRDHGKGIWQAGRPLHGTVTVTYRVSGVDHDMPQGGPITYLQDEAGGMSGAFRSFLLKPSVAGEHDITIRWQLRPGEKVVSNAGIGDVRQHTDFESLDEQMFVVGPLVHVPDVLNNRELVVAALGKPRAEVETARRWFAQAFAAMRSAFGDKTNDGYRIMVFSHDRQIFNSGTSRKGGFLFFLPPQQRLDEFKSRPTIAHEMTHSLVRSFPSQGNGGEDWYNEGIADYAEVVVPYTAGLYSPTERLTVLNQEAAFYYLNRLRNTPNDKISAIKWSANRAWSLGYSRGAMYFANLDAGLRNRGFRMTVFDFVQMMNALPAAQDIGAVDWENILRRHAGPWAVTEFRSMMAGDLIRPVDGAFGPCLRVQQIAAGHYDVGFAYHNLRKGTRVGAVDPGSNAERAGLREGDILREGFDESDAEVEFDRPSTFKLTRDGKPIDITFLPRSGNEIAYRFSIDEQSSDPKCRTAHRR